MATLTRSQFDRLNQLIIEQREIARKQMELEQKDKDNRAAILEIVGDFIPDGSTEGGEVFENVQVKINRSANYDAKAALEWATAPAQLDSAAPILTVSKAALPTIIRMVKEAGHNPTMFFELNKSGYAAMVTHSINTGAPYFGVDVRKSLTLIKPHALKTGDELAAMFDIVDDPEPAPEASPEAAV